MQKSRSTICKGTKHSLGKGNMGRYIDCSKASMASPSRALSEQRKIAKILKSVHEDIAGRESKEKDMKHLAAARERDHPLTPPQPRGSHERKGSPSEFRMLRRIISEGNVSADKVLAQKDVIQNRFM